MPASDLPPPAANAALPSIPLDRLPKNDPENLSGAQKAAIFLIAMGIDLA